MSNYKAEIYYTDGSSTRIDELTDDAKGLRRAFMKRQTIEITGPTICSLIDMAHVHNIKLIRLEAK